MGVGTGAAESGAGAGAARAGWGLGSHGAHRQAGPGPAHVRPPPRKIPPLSQQEIQSTQTQWQLAWIPASSDGLSHAHAKGANGLWAGFVSKTEVGAPMSNGLPAWGLGAHVAFCGDGANDAGALKVILILTHLALACGLAGSASLLVAPMTNA